MMAAGETISGSLPAAIIMQICLCLLASVESQAGVRHAVSSCRENSIVLRMSAIACAMRF